MTTTAADELRSARRPFVQVTVISAERPTSAKPGDTAVVLADGTLVGFVGGACAETSVRAQALQSLETGESVVLRITSEADAAPADRPGHFTVANPCLSGGTLEVFLEPQLPPVLVCVFGDAPIARALVEVGRAAGWDMQPVTDPSAPIPPDATAVVVASHGRHEEEVLAAALAAGVPYVGLVASRRRGAAVATTLRAGEALRTPAGFDIGARTPGEIAVSVLAEIVAVRPRPPASPPPVPAAAGRVVRDPVCGMDVVAAAPSEHADHDGVTSWFCGPGCRAAFVDAPERYCGSSAPGR
ncbi:MAG TPA: XdhC family protein [Acidimicrobiales bacterium]|nr:XdhC family protein [Acidimicrobiales bacterium]